MRQGISDTNETVELLRSRNITPTAPRLKLARLLCGQPQHLTAEEIYRRLNQNGTKISRASVYNNLHLFVKVGLLRTLNINPALTIYDTNLEPHHHLVDAQTGEIFDIPPDTTIPQNDQEFRFRNQTYQIESLQTMLIGRKI